MGFQNMSNQMQKPNIILHLDVTPEESLRRIKLRARSCESTVPLEYSRFRTADEIALLVKEEYAKISNIRMVTFSDILASPTGYVSTGSPDEKKVKSVEDDAAASIKQTGVAGGC